MMSDGPTPPKGSAKSRLVEKTTAVPTTESSAEKADPTVEQESTSRSEKSVIEEAPVTRAEFDALSAKLNNLNREPSGQPGVDMHTRSLGERRKASQCYDWEDKEGLVAIINNFTKEKEENYRRGTKEDETKIREFFQDYHPKCTILDTFRDKRKDEFNLAIDEIVQKLECGKKAISSFFLFIMSHGDQDCVTAYHGDNESSETLSINDDIICKFTKCIKGCPKVIVIQACRGQVDNHEVDRDSEKNTVEHPTDDCDELEDDSGSMFTIPHGADMLVAYATVRGYAAYRWKFNPGAWFLMELFAVLKESKYSNYHLVEVLTEVHYRVAAKQGVVKNKETKEKKYVMQMPCFMSSLRKRLYLISQSTSS